MTNARALPRPAVVVVGLVLLSLTLITHRAVAQCTPTYPSTPPADGYHYVCDWPSGCFRCHQERISVVAESCQATGSVIDIQNRIYQETVNISGTPFRLHYHSDRVPGRMGVAQEMNSATGQKLLSAAAMGGWVLDVFHIYFPSTGFLYPGDGLRRDIKSEGGPISGRVKGELLVASRNGAEVYVFDATGRHLRTVDALTGARVYGFTYDTAGRLSEVTDRALNVTRLERGSAGELKAIVAPFGQRTTFTLDGNGYLKTIVNPANETTQLHYTAQGLLDTLTDPRLNVKNPGYNAAGELTGEMGAAGSGATVNRQTTVTGFDVTYLDGLKRATIYRTEGPAAAPGPGGGQRQTVIRPSGLRTGITTTPGNFRSISQPAGRLTSVQFAPDPRWGMQVPFAAQTDIGDPAGFRNLQVSRARVVQLGNSADPLSLTSLTERRTIQSSAAPDRTYETRYDAASRTITTVSPEARQTTTVLDPLGRISDYRASGLAGSHVSYNTNGLVDRIESGSGPDTRSLAIDYDGRGLVKTLTDSLGGTATVNSRDAAGRVKSIKLPGSQPVGYTHDASGNLTTVTPPGRPAHGFAYGPSNRLSSYTPPAVSGGGQPAVYRFNAAGQLDSHTRHDGTTVKFGYDAAGRLASIGPPNVPTSPTTHFTYDYNPDPGGGGELRTLSAPAGSVVTYDYESLSRVSRAEWSGAVAGIVSYGYGTDWRPESVSVDNGDQISLEFDKDNLLTRAGDMLLTRYPNTGLVSSTELGVIKDSWSYNTFGELTDYSVPDLYFYSPLQKLDYVANYRRDPLGRVWYKSEKLGSVRLGYSGPTYEYRYDTAGRLEFVLRSGSVIAQYGYGANGNRTSVTTQAGTVSASYDNQDRLLQYGSATYTHTPNGERKTKTDGGQTTTYEYDFLGNLTAAVLPDKRRISYVLDGARRRVGRRINGALDRGYLYQDGLRVVAELDGSNMVVRQFVYGTRANVPDYMIKRGRGKQSDVYRIISDNLGSPRFVVNVISGQIDQEIEYDAFGNVVFDTNPGFQPFGFAGGLYDRDTKLVHFGARDYDAETGRWTTKDPISFAGGQLNLYTYVSNNPVNLIDPRGLISWRDALIILTIIRSTVVPPTTPFDEVLEGIIESIEKRNEVREELETDIREKRKKKPGAGPDPDPEPEGAADGCPDPEQTAEEPEAPPTAPDPVIAVDEDFVRKSGTAANATAAVGTGMAIFLIGLSVLTGL